MLYYNRFVCPFLSSFKILLARGHIYNDFSLLSSCHVVNVFLSLYDSNTIAPLEEVRLKKTELQLPGFFRFIISVSKTSFSVLNMICLVLENGYHYIFTSPPCFLSVIFNIMFMGLLVSVYNNFFNFILLSLKVPNKYRLVFFMSPQGDHLCCHIGALEK